MQRISYLSPNLGALQSLLLISDTFIGGFINIYFQLEAQVLSAINIY